MKHKFDIGKCVKADYTWGELSEKLGKLPIESYFKQHNHGRIIETGYSIQHFETKKRTFKCITEGHTLRISTFKNTIDYLYPPVNDELVEFLNIGMKKSFEYRLRFASVEFSIPELEALKLYMQIACDELEANRNHIAQSIREKII